MYAWIAVAVGGALGSVARHGMNRAISARNVNCQHRGLRLIGVLAGLVATGRLPMRPTWREFVFVGILGGFTTFSTFGLDTITLVRSGESSQAFLNIMLQVVGGLAAVQTGLFVVERIGVPR